MPPDSAALDDTATAPASALAAAGVGLAVGVQLGHFRVERKLGAGGMGEVYLATDLALDRPVALKLLPDEMSRDPVRRDRLIREARAQARVVHPNVGHIYFVGEDAGRLFFAMEYVPGVTLGERVANGPLAVDEALGMIRSAALGLREAQRSGFTHRDVKPSNLMLDGHGVVKVLDFGLVAGAGTIGEVATDGGSQASLQTSLGGTPLYMAPEQARGEPVDFRADIYALGATLYHLLSGKPPFVADTAGELLALHANAKRPAVPRGRHPRTARAAIDALCARMMAPQAASRFATYDELIRALELASAEHTRPAGFVVRLIASGIDLMLTSLFAVLGTLVVDHVTGYSPISGNLVELPLFFLLVTFDIARRGKTPGKTLFELEVIDLATGAPPLRRRAATRTLAMIGVPLFGSVIAGLLSLAGYSGLSTVVRTVADLSMVLVIGALFVAAVGSPNKRTFWDRASGTIVRYRGTTRV